MILNQQHVRQHLKTFDFQRLFAFFDYISKNTIIPYLFDAAKKKCAVAFQPGSALWRLLQDDPDRYIYPAVRKGVIDDDGNVIPLPDIDFNIRAGNTLVGFAKLDDVKSRWRAHSASRRTKSTPLSRKLRLSTGRFAGSMKCKPNTAWTPPSSPLRNRNCGNV